MLFAAPIWLTLLAPWAGVTLWLLWGRRRATAVPFLDLWRSEQPARRAKRWVQLPPLALAAALVAMVLAILGAARPAVRSRATAGGGGPGVTIVLDRGITMSPIERRREVIDAARQAVAQLGHVPVELVTVPPTDQPAGADWAAVAAAIPGTVVDTRSAVALAVRQASARDGEAAAGTVLVLSDHAVPVDARVFQIAPTKPLSNVGITRVAARQSPRAEVMVTVGNDSDLSAGTLVARSGKESKEQPIDLPPRGGERNYFIDLPSLADTVIAELRAADELPVDNVAYLARQAPWPAVEIRDAVPGEVRRVAEAYARARPPRGGAKHVAVANAVNAVEAGEPAAIVAEVAGASQAPRAGDDVKVQAVAQPITADVDWNAIARANLAAAPGADWTPLVTLNGRAAVAVREGAARQVWVGFDEAEFFKSPDFVILWTHIFDWLGGGVSAADEFAATTSADALPEEWQRVLEPTTAPTNLDASVGALPGLYRRADGAVRAVNVTPVTVDPPPASHWRAKVAAMKPAARGSIDLSPPVFLAAVACLLLAACAWPRRRLTPFSPPRTV